MFQVEICSQQLEICKSVCMFIVLAIIADSSIIIVRNVCVLTSASMIVYLFFTRSWLAIIGPKLFFTRLWSAIITLRMSDNLPERVQILCHAHIICITVRENRIICCQIFCDLLLKSAFDCQECVRAYLSIHDCLSFLHEVIIGNHRNKTTES
jgi:hypothetical protein